MNYQETLDFMFSQLPMYQRIGKAAYKANLDNTIALLSALGNPENTFKSIHIAGTNGKGSTSHMLASVFQEAGYKTGLYTSPHLIDFRERIRIDGEVIPEGEVIYFIASIKEIIEEIKPSFFELTVAMAFTFFQKEEVDIAIIETGLGGRLDSTNVLLPELAVITNIGMDHMQFLGDNLTSIAKEKGGIIKSNVPVVIGQVDQNLHNLFSKIAKEKSAPIYFSEDAVMNIPKCDLQGDYQKYNIKTAITAIDVMKDKGWNISNEAINKGFLNIRKNTGLAGRWDIINESPKAICDTGHNAEGFKEVLAQLQKENYKKLHIVLGVVDDKSLKEILLLFPSDAHYYFCRASVPRSLDANTLKGEATKVLLKGDSYNSVAEAYSMALEKANKEDVIFIGGSTFVVADLLNYLGTKPD